MQRLKTTKLKNISDTLIFGIQAFMDYVQGLNYYFGNRQFARLEAINHLETPHFTIDLTRYILALCGYPIKSYVNSTTNSKEAITMGRLFNVNRLSNTSISTFEVQNRISYSHMTFGIDNNKNRCFWTHWGLESIVIYGKILIISKVCKLN